METSSSEIGLVQKDLIDRKEAIRVLDDKGEHKFLFQDRKGPVFIVETSLEDLRERNIQPRLHEQLLESLINKGLVTDPKAARGGYCRVDDGELLFWGPSSYPVTAAEEKVFNDAVDIGRIKIIDQWLGENPES